jgi:hypothetical protein
VSPYRKFVAAVVGAIVVILHQHGVEVAEDISEPVIAAVTAALVFNLPNG